MYWLEVTIDQIFLQEEEEEEVFRSVERNEKQEVYVQKRSETKKKARKFEYSVL